MLGLFSRKDLHPLADARELKRVLAEIAARDPLDAVEDCNVWLESIAGGEDFKLAQRLELIFALDEAAVAQARRLGRDYPSLRNANRMQEARHWDVSHAHWDLLAAAYLDWLERHGAAEKKEADAVRGQLPLLYARLINALGAQLKWKQFRYGPVESDYWSRLGRAYLAACDERIAQKPLHLYSGGAETSVETEYLKVLVFRATSLDKLQPLGIEIAERFISHYLPYFSLIREVRPDNVYWVDAAKPLPPTRLAQLPEVTPTLRFFSGNRALEAVNTTLEQVRAEGHVPAAINLGGQYSAEAVIPVLEHLAMCWSPKPPMRSTARHRISSPLKVVNGLAAVHQVLSGSEANLHVESWVVDDVSLGGLGAQVTVSRNDWIRIGALVGMQPHGGDNWLIGIVRRYVRTGPTQGAVGVETVSKVPRAVMADAAGLPTEAVLLDLPEVGECARMVLPTAALEENVALRFPLDDKNTRVHPRETLETGADFVVANFFVQSHS